MYIRGFGRGSGRVDGVVGGGWVVIKGLNVGGGMNCGEEGLRGE
jgi:hypothetical protein